MGRGNARKLTQNNAEPSLRAVLSPSEGRCDKSPFTVRLLRCLRAPCNDGAGYYSPSSLHFLA